MVEPVWTKSKNSLAFARQVSAAICAKRKTTPVSQTPVWTAQLARKLVMVTNVAARQDLQAQNAKSTPMNAPARLVRTTDTVLTRQMAINATVSLPLKEQTARQVFLQSVLYCVAFRCILSRCVSLCCAGSRCVAFHCVTLRCVALRCNAFL